MILTLATMMLTFSFHNNENVSIDSIPSFISRHNDDQSISCDDATIEQEVPMKYAHVDDDESLQNANDDNEDGSLSYHSIPSLKNHSVKDASNSSEDTSLQYE